MYVVIGVWDTDPKRREIQHQMLDTIVAGVRQAPRVVKGYWCESADKSRSHTFIAFDDRSAAEAFAEDVRGNAANQAMAGVTNVSLDIAQVVATT